MWLGKELLNQTSDFMRLLSGFCRPSRSGTLIRSREAVPYHQAWMGLYRSFLGMTQSGVGLDCLLNPDWVLSACGRLERAGPAGKKWVRN